MKKVCVFLNFTLILFFVFACKMPTLPSKLEITGSPSIKFAANLNFSDYFSDMSSKLVSNSNGLTKVLPCTNTALNYMTFVLRMELFNTDYTCNLGFDINNNDHGNIIIDTDNGPVSIPSNVTGEEIVLNDEAPIVQSEEHFILSFGNISEFLDGLEIHGLEAKIFVSGSPLVEVLNINLHQHNSDESNRPIYGGTIENKSSGIGPNTENYPETSLPPGSSIIEISDMFHSGGEIGIQYKVSIKPGKSIKLEWLGVPQHILAEIVIWLPLEFDTMRDNVSIKFPDFFKGIGDTIKSVTGIGLIESMNIKIGISPSNPFGTDGIFVIKDNTPDSVFEITNNLDEHNFILNLSEEQIDYINENPFDPKFSILYPNSSAILGIPNGNIMLTTVLLNAKLKYNVDIKK